jgi:type IV pilus assembly protein PilM
MAIFRKPAIGLDISDHSVEAVLILRKGDRHVVASYGRTTLPPGTVVDGYVERRDELSVILRKLLSDQMTPPLPRGLDRVVFALPESQVYGHIFEVPRQADERELGRSLAVEADGFFPYNHAEMVAGYTVINQRPDKKEIYYAAVHRETLKSYLSLFAVSGLTPIAVEGEATSIARATLLPNEADPAVFVDIGARVTNVSVFDRNGIQFSESLETAGDAFTKALSLAMGISADDADSLKRNQGLSDQLDLKAQKALRGEVDHLIKDIREAVAYYEDRSKRLVSRILVCGGSILMPGLLEYLSEKLPTSERGWKVLLVDPWTDLQIDPVLDRLGVRARGVLVTTAIGLALRGVDVRRFAEIDFMAGIAPQAAVKASRPTLSEAPAVPHLEGKPAGRRWSVWIKVGAVAVGTILLAFLTWLAAFVVIPRFRKGPTAPPAATAPTTLAVEATALLSDVFSEEEGRLDGVPIEVETTVVKEFARQAEKGEGKAAGTIDLINTTRNAQTLVATTRLLSEGGILFRLDDRVLVPAGGRISAHMTADRAGAQGDVPAGRFTIPGLSAALQTQVYGETKEAMRGGVTYIGTPYTAEELEKAKSLVAAEAAEELYAAVLLKAGDDSAAPRGLFAVTATEVPSAPVLGAAIGDYRLEAKIKAKAHVFSRLQAEALLRKSLQASLGEAADASRYAFTDVTYGVEGYDVAAGEAKITIKAQAAVTDASLP